MIIEVIIMAKQVNSGSENPSHATSRQSLYKEFDMHVDHVLGLKETSNFDEKDRAVHLEHNRVLQNGFHSGNSVELLDIIQRNYSATMLR